ncbi:related to 2-polyprenyl-6-methoxyphenol hydroxylase and related FAD-dependent oxidoreductases [Rhynchosporium graminicola]|uniref:Related to 2-polyprenyl-6-methoxyphenol hydroxylase and related FAD-dependent oxidoreductases n=1 Tax=Rhynchosporium graminicola TaxID=2792576 RepID=A0A1E1JRC8_9HELO|nr:related to 2-polyprenyl-6-methoxyphenol hydroxylase and related FAD-dependent oxidoreductases [Rhynchosporium commune]
MTPGKDNEGFQDETMQNGIDSEPEIDGNDSHVTVIGAGPADAARSNLVRYGIKTTIVDDRPDKTSTGRADGLQPKTIETFKQLGLAGPLLQKGARIYEICFWNGTATQPLRRIGRAIHYPPGAVDVQDPFILLVHQGMVEDVFLNDLKIRGVEVIRSMPLSRYRETTTGVEIECLDSKTGKPKSFTSRYMVGCDGAHSNVRKSLLQGPYEGERSNSAWGVLDGVIETDFPDIWSKTVISSETEGSVLFIPREKNMTRLYIELNSQSTTSSPEIATQEFVMARARVIMAPFKLSWKIIEWFGIYKVGQRVAKKFSGESETVFIAGDAAHSHSPKAAQGMNVGMHDAFNLSWKLNLVIRSLAHPSLLSTCEQELRKIAQDLINFDYGHAVAFVSGDHKKLAQNFAKNIRFISGVGAEYSENALNLPEKVRRGALQPGCLMVPARLTRYIDANPVNLQLEVPMIGQFRLFFFTNNIKVSSPFLEAVCAEISSSRTVLGRVTAAANASYAARGQPKTEMDSFIQPQRYVPVSSLVTYAIVTTMPKARIEIADLPPLLQDSRWTFYLDNLMRMPTATEKWIGPLKEGVVGIVNIRPDGYVGSIGRWNSRLPGSGAEAVSWLDSYYGAFLKG